MDCIALVVSLLKAATELAGVPISTEIPPTRAGRFVVVGLTGDESDLLILRPRVMLTVWGNTDADAHGLAVTAYHVLAEAAQTHDSLSFVELESMSRDEWTANGQSRYAVQLNLTINT